MLVYFLNFSKKSNSTGQPNITENTLHHDCTLKTPCNVMKPSIELTGLTWALATNYLRLNYAQIPNFNRYYFIKNWHFVNAKIICELEVDVLATYKAQIEASTQYVLRSASLYDGSITDSKYPIKSTAPTITAGYFANNPLISPADGVVVVGIVNKTGSITGCVSYYVMGIYAFSELCTKLFSLSTQWGEGGTDIADGIKKAITDPFQYFVSAVWLPYVVTDFTSRNLATQTSAVFCGYDTITLTNYAYVFVDQIEIAFTNLIQFSVPFHPQSASRGNYLNFAPYSRYYLSFYPFTGLSELDASAFAGLERLYAIYTVDLRTGKGVCNICKDYVGSSYADWKPSQILRCYEAQVGVSIPIAAIHTALPQSIADGKLMAITGAATAVTQSGGFAQSLKKVLSSASSVFADIVGADEQSKQEAFDIIGAQPFTSTEVSKIAQGAFAAKTTVEISGSQGTMSFNQRMPIAFWGEFVPIVDEANAINGRPLCQYRRLVPTDGTAPLTGFICCDNPKIAAPSGAYQSEIAEIENYLAAGMFLE